MISRLRSAPKPRHRPRVVIDARGAAAGVPELHAETTQVVAFVLGALIEARQIDVLADASIRLPRLSVQRRQKAAHVEAELLAEMTAEYIVAVADAVGKPLAGRVEQQPRGVDAARRDDHHFPAHFLFATAHAIEVLHAARPPAIVDEHARRHRVRANFELLRRHRCRKQVIGGTEERRGVTPATASVAVVALREATHRARHVGATPADDANAARSGGLLQQALAAARSRRRKVIFAPRQRLLVVVAAADANQLIDLVVVRRDVRVAKRPRRFPAVFRGALEIEVAVAQADAAPDVGLAAVAPHSPQLEGTPLGADHRLLLLRQQELLGPLAARAPRPRLVRRHVGPELRAIELRPGVEQAHLDALLRQVPRRHPARGAAADDDDGIEARGTNDLHVVVAHRL